MYYLPKTAFSRLEILFKMSTLLFADFELLEANDSKSANNNVDILKRISNLEKAVFGK
jgi:hypothetical protein